MITHHRRTIDIITRFAACLLLTSVLGIVGCGNPREGTLQVSPEARARFSPARVPRSASMTPRPVATTARSSAPMRIDGTLHEQLTDCRIACFST
jgi:hypothetical protein